MSPHAQSKWHHAHRVGVTTHTHTHTHTEDKCHHIYRVSATVLLVYMGLVSAWQSVITYYGISVIIDWVGVTAHGTVSKVSLHTQGVSTHTE